MISRARKIIAHWHKEAETYEGEGFPLLARGSLRECEVIEGLLAMIPWWKRLWALWRSE